MQERLYVVSLLPYRAREIGPNLPRKQVTWELRAHNRLKFGCAILTFAFNASTVTFHLPSLLSHSSCFNENRCSCSSHKANAVHRRFQFLFTSGASLLSGRSCVFSVDNSVSLYDEFEIQRIVEKLREKLCRNVLVGVQTSTVYCRLSSFTVPRLRRQTLTSRRLPRARSYLIADFRFPLATGTRRTD